MSDGGIAGNGLTFWATIRIAGELEQPQLKAVTNRIRDILNENGINGEIVHSIRVTADEMPVVTIQLQESRSHAGGNGRPRNRR